MRRRSTSASGSLPRRQGRRTSGVFEVIAHGVLCRTRLRIKYLARSTGETTQREVSPQRLVHYRDNWYLDGGATRATACARFRSTRSAPRFLSTKRPSRSATRSDRRLGSGYGIFSGENVEWASLRFTPQRARWVAQEQWHPAQRGRLESDGTYILEVPFADPRELMMDILKYGAHVAVLGPESLRQVVANEVRRMVAVHGRGPPRTPGGREAGQNRDPVLGYPFGGKR